MQDIESKKKKLRHIFLLILLALALAWVNFGQAMMQSANFRVDSDVIGSEGGPGGSANYKATDTMGEPAIGESGSANYKTKAGFWYMGGQAAAAGLGLTCSATSVYMNDYTLGNANNYNLYDFTSPEKCTVTHSGNSTPWSFNLTSTNLTGAKNNLSNTHINLTTDGNPLSAPTLVSTSSGITEAATNDWSLDQQRNIIQSASGATGTWDVQIRAKLTNLNNLYQETNDTATFTFTVS